MQRSICQERFDQRDFYGHGDLIGGNKYPAESCSSMVQNLSNPHTQTLALKSLQLAEATMGSSIPSTLCSASCVLNSIATRSCSFASSRCSSGVSATCSIAAYCEAYRQHTEASCSAAGGASRGVEERKQWNADGAPPSHTGPAAGAQVRSAASRGAAPQCISPHTRSAAPASPHHDLLREAEVTSPPITQA